MKAFFLMLLLIAGVAQAQEQGGTSLAQVQKMVNDTLANKWYERIQLKGYAQFRYNRFFESNDEFNSPTTDKSIGKNQGVFLRRARLTFFGEVSDRVFIYIQPDYSTDAVTSASGSTSQNFLQIRDAYFDYALSEDKVWRLRTGISKVPYGFENLQSSSNRPAFDRTDALNTGVPNERDTGIFLMVSPEEIRKRFKDLTANNLKGSGDYGMFAFGVYNGQSLNKPEANNNLHKAIRLTYPFKLNNGQFIEASIQAYEGQFRITSGPDAGKDFYDQRTAGSIIIYPQPFGFQAEYNVGSGPEFDAKSGTTKDDSLHGGYAQINYQHNWQNHRFFPYVRYQDYDGGRKIDNGNHMITKEWEFGTEWQPNPALEITVAYAVSDRKVESATPAQNFDEEGQLLRLQAHFNY